MCGVTPVCKWVEYQLLVNAAVQEDVHSFTIRQVRVGEWEVTWVSARSNDKEQTLVLQQREKAKNMKCKVLFFVIPQKTEHRVVCICSYCHTKTAFIRTDTAIGSSTSVAGREKSRPADAHSWQSPALWILQYLRCKLQSTELLLLTC